MAHDIPADWYPDSHGTVRWWDGSQWTDHVREDHSTQAPPTVSDPTTASTSVLPSVGGSIGQPRHSAQPTSTTATTQVNTVAHSPSPAPKVTSRVIYPVHAEEDEEEVDETESDNRRVWLTATAVGLAAFFLGMGMGSREAPAAISSAEPNPVVVTDSPELDQREADLDDRESQLDERQAQLERQERDLADRKQELDQRALQAPPAPTTAPTATATGTIINGDATVLVGTDVRSGTYRTDGAEDAGFQCHFTISRDSAGQDVISEGTGDASTRVTLSDGQYFDSDDCRDWFRE